MEFEGGARDLLIFLVAAGVVVPLFARFRLGIVLGFIIAGLILGPGGLGSLTDDAPWLAYITFDSEERVAPFAELGVLFLLFTIGLELSAERLWAMRRMVFGAGTLQMVLSTIVVAGLISWITGEIAAGIVFGLGLSFSSTAISLQVLIEQRRLGTEVGQASLGILLMQDLMVVPGVILVTILAGEGTESVWFSIARGLGIAIAAVAIILVAGRFIMRPLLAAAASTKSRDIMMAIALLLAIGAAFATAAAGLSTALGAFLAGLLLGSSQYRHQIEVDIEPFKGLLLGLFFMTVGMTIDLPLLGQQLLAVLAALAALLVIKAGLIFAILKAFGLRSRRALETALLLAGAGEFAFVLFTLAGQEGLLTRADTRFLTTVGGLSMLVTPILGAVGRRISDRMARRGDGEEDKKPEDDLQEFADHVVIGGFGRVGEMVARALEATATPYVALDLDAERVAEARAAKRNVYFGDISRPEILERIGGNSAKAFVITADLPAETERTVRAIRQMRPDVAIYARARDILHALELVDAGATHAVPEAFEGSIELAQRVLEGLGLPDDAVDSTIDEVRREAMARAKLGNQAAG